MPLGSHIAISDGQRKQLESLASDEDRIEFVNELMEEWNDDLMCGTDKAWDAIHRCLTESPPNTENMSAEYGTYPLRLCIMGGKKLTTPNTTHFLYLIEPHEVDDIAKALAPIDEASMKEKYRIHCRGAWPEYGEDDMEYTWEYFQAMRDFFVRVAGTGRAVIFNADQ